MIVKRVMLDSIRYNLKTIENLTLKTVIAISSTGEAKKLAPQKCIYVLIIVQSRFDNIEKYSVFSVFESFIQCRLDLDCVG